MPDFYRQGYFSLIEKEIAFYCITVTHEYSHEIFKSAGQIMFAFPCKLNVVVAVNIYLGF